MPARMGLRSLTIAALAAALPAGSALAQPFVTLACMRFFTGAAADHFDNPAHAAWYRRFWSGSCAGVPEFCMGGQPNWNREVDALAAQAAPNAKASVSDKACRLGHTIGLEWARANDVRRISTADLRALSAMLHTASPPETRLMAVEARVGQLMR